jgi:hypothetical protein
MEKLFLSSFLDSDPLEPQIDQMKLTARSLESVGFPLDDKWLAGIIVMKLPESMATLKAILSHTDSTKLTSNAVINEILVDEARRIRVGGGDATAFFAKAAGKRDKNRESNWDPNKNCTHCNRRGHDITDCRKLKREKEKEEKTAKEKATSSDAAASANANATATNTTATAAIAKVPSNDDIIRLFRATAIEEHYAGTERIHTTRTELETDDLLNNWLVDSGASRMMSSRREWFTNFILLPKPIKVVLGDNSNITATGIGSIAAHTFDGNRWAPALFRDVLYVPRLHGNLLSVSHITRRGYEMRFAGNNCRVLDHAGETACTGLLQNNLYLMNIQVATTENARVAHLDQLSQDEETLEYALTAHTTRHRHLDHPHADEIECALTSGASPPQAKNIYKRESTFNDQGGATATKIAKAHALIVYLVAHLAIHLTTAPRAFPHHVRRTNQSPRTATPTSYGSRKLDVHHSNSNTTIDMHMPGPNFKPLAARGRVGIALATRLQQSQRPEPPDQNSTIAY